MEKYIVNSEMEGMRVDRFLKKICKDEPLSKIFGAIRKGDIKINGKKTKENYRLCLEDEIIIKYLETKKEKKIQNIENFKFDEKKYKEMIIFENEDFFIVNKARNIAMHKGTGHKFGLSEVFKKIYNNENINFANRLDFETSGLVIGCKNLKFLRYISEKIRNNEVKKKYLAVVYGNMENFDENFKIENYLVTTENGVKVSKDGNEREAKKSITNFKKINFFNNLEKQPNFLKKINYKNITFLDIDLITGRKHQIRAQLSNIGYPIIGDKKYGKNEKNDIFYLNCYSLSFDKFEFELKKNEIWN